MNISYLENGDLIFKSSKLTDGRIFIGIINAITRFWSRSSYDHVEVVTKVGKKTLVSSSDLKSGVRTIDIETWFESVKYPNITILRPEKKLDRLDILFLENRIKNDLGKDYDIAGAINSRIIRDQHEASKEKSDKKLFCSEAVSKWTGDIRWQNTWPDELYDRKIEKGYTIIYKGESQYL